MESELISGGRSQVVLSLSRLGSRTDSKAWESLQVRYSSSKAILSRLLMRPLLSWPTTLMAPTS